MNHLPEGSYKIKAMARKDNNLIKNLITDDKTFFHMDIFVSKQNSRFLGQLES